MIKGGGCLVQTMYVLESVTQSDNSKGRVQESYRASQRSDKAR